MVNKNNKPTCREVGDDAPLLEALDELVSDPFIDERDHVASLQERFNLERELLVQGRAHLLDRPDWWLAFDAIEHLAELLKSGKATSQMQALLSDYLTNHVLNRDEKTAFAVLGMPKGGGRTRKDLERLQAIEAYRLHIADHPDKIALAAAWVAYYPEKKMEEEVRRPAGDGSNSYDQSIDRTIKPLLHRARVRKPDAPGRPAKSLRKT